MIVNFKVPGSYKRVSRLDEQQHQQAAGDVENVRNSVMHNFGNFR